VTCPTGEFSRRYKIKAVRTDLHPLSTPNDIQVQVSSFKLYFVPSHLKSDGIVTGRGTYYRPATCAEHQGNRANRSTDSGG
jgi:hypothetical protein